MPETNREEEKDGSIRLGQTQVPLKAGTSFFMGHWGRKALRWRVLSVEKETMSALVITETLLDGQCYYPFPRQCDWGHSFIREWLNGEFAEKALSEYEKEAVLPTDLKNEANRQYRTDGGAATRDRIFLLSMNEVRSLFSDNEDRATGSWWWLRSPGYCTSYAAEVDNNGYPNDYGDDVVSRLGIRPACRVALDSSFMRSLLKEENGTLTLIEPALIIREGVVTAASPYLTSVCLPSFVTGIAAGAFSGCPSLKKVDWEAEDMHLAPGSFADCPSLQLPDKLFLTDRPIEDVYAAYLTREPRVLASVLFYQENTGLWQKACAERIDPENAGEAARSLIDLVKNAQDPSLRQYLSLFRLVLTAAVCLDRQELTMTETLLEKADLKDASPRESALMSGMIFWIRHELLYYPKPSYLLPVDPALLTVDERIFTVIPDEETHLAPLADILAVTACYTDMMRGKYLEASGLMAIRDRVSGRYEKMRALWPECDSTHLIALLKLWARKSGAGESWFAPFAVYCRGRNLVRLEKKIPDLILLNDTAEAMRIADSCGKLERYAALRRTDADTLRENVIADFGFRDRAEAEQALELPCHELSETVRLIHAALREAFLSGRKRPGRLWQEAYLKNPLLVVLSGPFIFLQDGRLFVIRGQGHAENIRGERISLSDGPVMLAHPMEMTEEERKIWESRLQKENLPAPFPQLEEPLIPEKSIRPDRYIGKHIPLFMLEGRENEGISLIGQSRLLLRDCIARIMFTAGSCPQIEITDFRFNSFTRQVNHILGVLDLGVLAGRLLKDDVSVRPFLPLFSADQIRLFIEKAAKQDCPEVSAMLLQYQAEHPELFDPFDDLAFDW